MRNRIDFDEKHSLDSVSAWLIDLEDWEEIIILPICIIILITALWLMWPLLKGTSPWDRKHSLGIAYQGVAYMSNFWFAISIMAASA
jgi:hypothetical protein